MAGSQYPKKGAPMSQPATKTEPAICEMANRPGFDSTKAIDDFRRAHGDDPFFAVLKWKCRYCWQWHFSEEV